jgi:hypothetical protein
MTGATTSKPVTARDIYYAYPGSDLLNIDPPDDQETIPAYITRIGGREVVLECGDTLFAFILFELSNDDIGPEECLRLLDNAHSDLFLVRSMLSVKLEKNS